MPGKSLWIGTVVLLGLLLVMVQILNLFVGVSEVNAAVTSCSVSVSPSSVTNNSNNSFTITIQNTDSVNYSWIKITRPNSYFEIQSNPGSGSWSTSTNTESSTLLSGSLTPGGSVYVTLYVDIRNGVEGSYNWTVQASDDVDGGSPFNCTGSLTTSIVSGGSDNFPPVISNVGITDVLDTTATITWTTDEASTSIVYYDTSSDYSNNLSKSDSSLTTSHSLSLTGLTANATYYFYVESADSTGNAAASGDFSFTAAKASTTVTVVNTETKTVTKTETKTIIVEDTEKPVIKITTKFDEAFSGTPNVAGKVTDNAGVSEIEYSFDGGENWLPVDETTGILSKSVNFQFSIFNLLDGNYKIKVRATDLSGNIQLSEEKTLIFDRLPPAVGGVMYSLGSQILTPIEGVLEVIAGVEFKLTLSAVGGPSEIVISSKLSEVSMGQPENDRSFRLTKNPDTGLWIGRISFAEAGRYTLNAVSLDGAGNETVKVVGIIQVLPKGKVFTNFQLSNSNYQIFVYYLEPSIGQFVLWDGIAYGQTNPVEVGINNNYALILPPGKYYLQVRSGRGKSSSEIFELNKTTPVNSDFKLTELIRFNFGPISFVLPEIFQPQLKVNLDSLKVAEDKEFTTFDFPNFELTDGTSTYDTYYFRGKSTVYTFINTWLPQTAEQLAILENISEVGVNNVIIVPQESVSKVNIFRSIGKYNKLILADPDGVLLSKINFNSMPFHLLVDRRGSVKEIVSGVLNEKEIAEILLID